MFKLLSQIALVALVMHRIQFNMNQNSKKCNDVTVRTSAAQAYFNSLNRLRQVNPLKLLLSFLATLWSRARHSVFHIERIEIENQSTCKAVED